MTKKLLIILVAFLSLPLYGGDGGGSSLSSGDGLGEVSFHGAWIATVANIDWPSEEAVGNTATQKEEMIGILDSLQTIGINAIIFQIRPTSDALYFSQHEPVSHWLTGTQGKWGKKDKETGEWQEQEIWDPLEWTIEQAHERNMEVHVLYRTSSIDMTFKPFTWTIISILTQAVNFKSLIPRHLKNIQEDFQTSANGDETTSI